MDDSHSSKRRIDGSAAYDFSRQLDFGDQFPISNNNGVIKPEYEEPGNFEGGFNDRIYDNEIPEWKDNSGRVNMGIESRQRQMNFGRPGAIVNDENMDIDGSPQIMFDLESFQTGALEVNGEDPAVESPFFTKDDALSEQRPGTRGILQNGLPLGYIENQNVQDTQRNSADNNSFVTASGYGHIREESVDSHYGIPEHYIYQGDPDNEAFGTASNANASTYAELSPLTTTTSLTQSINSLHSTQPSFFSAQQYLTSTPSDQPSSIFKRTSMDYYSKNKTSLDSQRSSLSQRRRNPNYGRYSSFTNSISNYIPFMGDRAERTGSNVSTPISASDSPASPNTNSFASMFPRQQLSRHIIRGIFQTLLLNNSNKPLENFPNNEFNVHNDTSDIYNSKGLSPFSNLNIAKDENIVDNSDMNAGTQNEKTKKPRRSLFTRFKTTVKNEPTEDLNEHIKMEDTNYLGDFSNENFKSPFNMSSMDQLSSVNEEGSISQTSQANSGFNPDAPFLATLQAGPLPSQGNTEKYEPNYSALFENVGKRKNIVNPASYIKPKPKNKTEQIDSQSVSNFTNSSAQSAEKSSILNLSSASSNSEISKSQGSINAGFNTPSEEVKVQDYGNSSNTYPVTGSSSLASASKRILGSKLALKKKNQNVHEEIPQNPATIINSNGVEVEVDLKSLDLPPNTKIFPTSIINSKTRTRGRKENKEADLLDLSKIFLCNYCSRRFKRQEHLKRHFRSLHTFEKPYDCPICNKKFSRSDNLNQHLKVHKQEDVAKSLSPEKSGPE